MSEYAVHFTKDGDMSAYSTMLRIRGSGTLLAGRTFGAARGLAALGDTQRAVCFSEVPLDRRDRLIERRSFYGIAFHQDLLVRAGGNRVWYVDEQGPVAQVVRGMVTNRAVPGMNIHDVFWQITPFIDFPSDTYGYRFEWEREWRVPSALHFKPDDVAFLFIPEALHAQARTFFTDAHEDHIGPAYLCPYLDPLWKDDQVQAAFALVAE
jgi:hypothetical protein